MLLIIPVTSRSQSTMIWGGGGFGLSGGDTDAGAMLSWRFGGGIRYRMLHAKLLMLKNREVALVYQPKEKYDAGLMLAGVTLPFRQRWWLQISSGIGRMSFVARGAFQRQDFADKFYDTRRGDVETIPLEIALQYIPERYFGISFSLLHLWNGINDVTNVAVEAQVGLLDN